MLHLFFWLVVGFLALCLVVIAASYFHFETDYHFLKSKQEYLPNKLWLSTFYLHLASGIVAVLAGFPLFFNRFIGFNSVWHKRTGRIYVYSILLTSGPTGFYLAFFAEGGPFASVGFILMSTIWMMITWVAVQKIIKGDLEGHRKWMIRSYCFTLSGVTLRLYTPFGANVMEFDYDTNFIISSYLPWMINIFIGECILLYSKNNDLKKLQTA